MSVVGILTNCCLMGITSNQLARILYFISPAGVAIILFAYEHIMLFFKYILHTSIPSVSPAVQRDQERKKSLTRKLHKKPDRTSRQPPQRKDRPSLRSQKSINRGLTATKPEGMRTDVGGNSFDAYLADIYSQKMVPGMAPRSPKQDPAPRQHRPVYQSHLPSFEEYEDEPLDAINLQSLLSIKRKSLARKSLAAMAPKQYDLEDADEIEEMESLSSETESMPNEVSSSSSSDCCRSVKSNRGYSLRLSRGPGPIRAQTPTPTAKKTACVWDTPYDSHSEQSDDPSPTLTATSLREIELVNVSPSSRPQSSRKHSLSPLTPLNLTPYSDTSKQSKQTKSSNQSPQIYEINDDDSPVRQKWSKTFKKERKSAGRRRKVSVGKTLQLGPPKHSPAVKRSSPKLNENMTPNRPPKTVKQRKNLRPAKTTAKASAMERSAAAYMAHLERYKAQRSASVVEVETPDKKSKAVKKSPAVSTPVMKQPQVQQDDKLKEFLKMWIRDHSQDEEEMENPFLPMI